MNPGGPKVCKVLLVVPSLAYSGTSKQLGLVAVGLPSPQFQVRVAVLGASGAQAEILRTRGIEVIELGWKRLIDLRLFRRLQQLLEAFRPDVLHAWHPLSLRVLSPLGVRRPRPLIVSAMGGPHRFRSFRQHFDSWLLRSADLVIATGFAEAENFRRQQIPESRIVEVPPGVTPPPVGGARDRFCRRLGIKEDARLLACVGPLAPEKGFQDAIWSFEMLRYVFENLHLILIGDGPDRSRLENFARLTGTEPHVHFLGQQPDAAALLRYAEVVWVPSRRQGGVNVALEAMAAGRPVVASRLPAMAEIVIDGETGFLIDPGDKMAMARKTRWLLSDPARSRRMGEAGRQRGEREFPAARLVDRFARVYEQAMAPHKITTE
jgi:glycosyltransferase involved in cell wall biosynthesis